MKTKYMLFVLKNALAYLKLTTENEP